MSAPTMKNRLEGQPSPYLAQHASNPVAWQPWDERAIAEARERDVPIFCSIGYSTCHWCHVMERESFCDEQIAKLMNERFVCVKVDREERPDLDDLYMTAVVSMTGHGGWPLNVFIEPRKLRPFYCGTYWPPQPRGNYPQFSFVLERISQVWQHKREEAMQQAEKLTQAVSEQIARRDQPVRIGAKQVQQAISSLLQVYDKTEGGFGGSPKFPQPAFIRFLLEARDVAGDDPTRRAVDTALRFSLDRMAVGGIYDHIGGGFHRYAVDRTWTVPHFEKMLYDNGQLAEIYALTTRLFGDRYHRIIARETCEYVAREMTHICGGRPGAFYAAQDAEVDAREGASYLWTPESLRAALSPSDAEFVADLYAVTEQGNFRDPHHPEDPPASVLRLADRPDRIAATLDMPVAELEERLIEIVTHLLHVRAMRKQPDTDDKVIAAWNGMMIAGMARTAAALGDGRWLHCAKAAADFVLEHMIRGKVLHRSWRDGVLGPPGFLQDDACLAHGLIALYHTRTEDFGETKTPYLDAAIARVKSARERFHAEDGGYYDTDDRSNNLFLRPRTVHDGAVPCGQSIMLHNLIELSEITHEQHYMDEAIALLKSMSAAIHRSPVSPIDATRGLLRLLRKPGLRERYPDVFTGADEEQIPDHASPEFTPVEVYASTERVAIGPDTPAEFKVVLRIKDGYHMPAADPGPAGEMMALVPLKVHSVGGEGLRVYADYPKGQPLDSDEDMLVYSGEIEITIAAEVEGGIEGRPMFAMTYQACAGDHCLRPTTIELDVALDHA